jgi:hypothetical protein
VAATDIEEVRLRLNGHDSVRLDRIKPYVFCTELSGDQVQPGRMMATLEVRAAGATWLSHGVPPADSSPAPFTVCQITKDLESKTAELPACQVEFTDDNTLRVSSKGFAPSAAAVFRLPANSCPSSSYDTLVVRARALHSETDRIEIGLVQSDGKAYGAEIPLWTEWQDVRYPLKKMRPLWSTPAGSVHLARVDQLSLVFGAWLYGPKRHLPHGYEVERIWLERGTPGWTIEVAAADQPVLLFTAGERGVKSNGQPDRRQELVRGSRVGRKAVRLWTDGFELPPSCISLRQPVSENLSDFALCVEQCDTLEIVARSTSAQTDKLEVALVERDSTAWGTTISLTQQWQRIRIPVDTLRFFDHWPHPAGRGVREDQLGLEDLAAVNFCFGAWLFGEKAGEDHGVEIESASLVRSNDPRAAANK